MYTHASTLYLQYMAIPQALVAREELLRRIESNNISVDEATQCLDVMRTTRPFEVEDLYDPIVESFRLETVDILRLLLGAATEVANDYAVQALSNLVRVVIGLAWPDSVPPSVARAREIQCIQALIEVGANLNFDYDLSSSSIVSCMVDNMQKHALLEYLLQRGMNPNLHGIMWQYGTHFDMLSLCIYHATRHRFVTEADALVSVRMILESGANVDTTAGFRHTTPLAVAVRGGLLRIAELIMEYRPRPVVEGVSIEEAALLSNQLRVVQFVVDHGFIDFTQASDTEDGVSLLAHAAVCCSADIVQYLLDNAYVGISRRVPLCTPATYRRVYDLYVDTEPVSPQHTERVAANLEMIASRGIAVGLPGMLRNHAHQIDLRLADVVLQDGATIPDPFDLGTALPLVDSAAERRAFFYRHGIPVPREEADEALDEIDDGLAALREALDPIIEDRNVIRLIADAYAIEPGRRRALYDQTRRDLREVRIAEHAHAEIARTRRSTNSDDSKRRNY